MKCVQNPAAGKAGFSLVEAMVAVFILGIGLGSSLLTYNMAMRRVSTNGDAMSAMHAGRAVVEQLRNAGWNHPSLAEGTYHFTEGVYTGTYTVTPTANANVRDVTVQTTQQTTMSGNLPQVTLVTSLAKPLR